MVRHGGWGSLSSKLPVVSGPARGGPGCFMVAQPGGHIKGWWAGDPKKWALPLGLSCLSLPSTPEKGPQLHLHLDFRLQHKVPGVFSGEYSLLWGVRGQTGLPTQRDLNSRTSLGQVQFLGPEAFHRSFIQSLPKATWARRCCLRPY